VPEEMLGGAKDRDKVVARFVEWDSTHKNPVAEVVKVLGQAGLHETEMVAILVDNGFRLEFPPDVLEESSSMDYGLTKDELARRRDFRGITTFTIDPVDAKDFDDAISFRVLDEGIYEIGVHIADVSHYVRPGTLTDIEAVKRATSVYLVDRTVPMLPERLSNDLCSLRPNEDKLTFSAVVQMDEKGKILDQWFGKTVIHSVKRFTYEEAQEVLEGAPSEYAGALLKLNELAYQLRKKDLKTGLLISNR
jgi:ribonuclease R